MKSTISFLFFIFYFLFFIFLFNYHYHHFILSLQQVSPDFLIIFILLYSYHHFSSPSVRAKRLRFAIIPEVTVTDTEADLFYLKIEKLIQFFRKYITENDKASMFVNFDKKSSSVAFDSCNSDVNLLNKDGNSEKDKDKDKEKDKEKGRKKKIDVNLLKIWLGTKGDPKWAFLQCDRIVSTSRVMHIEVRVKFSY